MKQLVINADDFGRDSAVNAAIAQAHNTGILTSASLLVTGPCALEAIAFARQHPRLGVGLHLCLVDGQPAAPLSMIQPLIARDGGLPPSPLALCRKLAFTKGCALAVATEARAQLDRFLASGLRPTHLDTHMHTHLHPRVRTIVAELATAYQIPFVRAPFEPLGLALRSGPGRARRKLARWIVFGPAGAHCRHWLRRSGLRTVDRAVGVLDPGHLTEEFLAASLERFPDGLTEIFFHPATERSVELGRCQPGYEHVAELRALCSPRIRASVEQHGIRLTNFAELAAEGPQAGA